MSISELVLHIGVFTSKSASHNFPDIQATISRRQYLP